MPGPYRRGCLKEGGWQLHDHRGHSYLAAAELHVCTSWRRIDDHLALARPRTMRSDKQKGSQRDSLEHLNLHGWFPASSNGYAAQRPESGAFWSTGAACVM